jgi:integral membrane protein (TIGR01906 family)
LVVLFSLCLLFALVYGAVLSVMHQQSLYAHITAPAQQQENARILSYLNGPPFTQHTLDFLTPAEASHMSDVKRLFDAMFITYLVCLGILIGILIIFAAQRLWHHFDELLGRSLRAVGWTLVGACLLFGLAAMLDFPRSWVLFHAVLFPQGNWAFPADSILITLYPGAFFSQFVLRVLLYLFLAGAIAALLSWFLLRMRTAEHQFSEAYERKHGTEQHDKAYNKRQNKNAPKKTKARP